jgi:hypothetical protein
MVLPNRGPPQRSADFKKPYQQQGQEQQHAELNQLQLHDDEDEFDEDSAKHTAGLQYQQRQNFSASAAPSTSDGLTRPSSSSRHATTTTTTTTIASNPSICPHQHLSNTTYTFTTA